MVIVAACSNLSGSVPLSQRMCTVFREPWRMDDEDIRKLINITKVQFFDLVVKQAGSQQHEDPQGLNIFSEVLLFMLKLTKSLPFRILEVLFVLQSHQHGVEIFKKQLIFYYLHNVNIPAIITPAGVTNALELEKLYQIARDSMGPFFRTLMSSMRDPSGQDRVCVLLNIDGTYFDLQGSSDVEYNKFLFYGPRNGKVAKFLNITTISGKIIAVLPICSSQSPSSGDGYLFQRLVGLEDDGPSENYLRVLLSGNATYFVVLVTGTFLAKWYFTLYIYPFQVSGNISSHPDLIGDCTRCFTFHITHFLHVLSNYFYLQLHSHTLYIFPFQFSGNISSHDLICDWTRCF